MSEPIAVEGIGIQIWFTTSANTYVGSPSWTQVEGLRDVIPPTTGKTENKEVTTHGTAVSTHRKSYGPGLIEPSDWSFKQLYTAATYNTLIALQRVKKGWKVIFSDGGTYYADSYITEGKIDSPQDGFNEVEWSMFNFGTELFATSS